MRKVLVLVRQYCKSIGTGIAILLKNLYWYWYWQYFFQAVLILALSILFKVMLTTLNKVEMLLEHYKTT